MTGSVFVTIDSRDREGGRGEHPGSYTARLLEDVRDVCSVKVRSTDIPPMWNVPAGRSSLWVSSSLGGAFDEVSIRPADHTPATAADALREALDAATPLSWAVSVTPLGRIEFSANGAFSIRGGDGVHPDGYGPRSAGRALGLAAEAVASSGNALTAAHAHQLGRADTMFLHVEDYDAVHGATSGLHNCTEVINANGAEHEIPAEKHFHPPLSRVNRLRIRITDYYGSVIDFDNRENRIDLQFVTGDAKKRSGRGYGPAS